VSGGKSLICVRCDREHPERRFRQLSCLPTGYLKGRLSSFGLVGRNHFSNRLDAQSALPVGMDRTTEQSPALLETNDVNDTRIDRD
jgi:hypothetical protein